VVVVMDIGGGGSGRGGGCWCCLFIQGVVAPGWSVLHPSSSVCCPLSFVVHGSFLVVAVPLPLIVIRRRWLRLVL
jgi:hypothetical protein